MKRKKPPSSEGTYARTVKLDDNKVILAHSDEGPEQPRERSGLEKKRTKWLYLACAK